MKHFVHIVISIFCFAGLCACNQEELEGLQSQIDELKSSQIASIDTQISNIQSSISTMEQLDDQLKARIEELSRTEQGVSESLTQKEAALSKRIDELKAYVDEELKKQTDWVTATFSTLEQYQNTCNEIASIKQDLSSLETTLKGLISNTENSIKLWVNDQLTGYYTIAEMNAKISALEQSIANGDNTQSEELAKLKSDLESAKTNIKEAYEKAISDAITTCEGKINDKIAADIKTATDALQGQIDEINTKIVDIETRLGIIEASLEKILARIQSIVVVPNNINSRVLLRDSEDTEILFEVSPRSASVALAQQDIEVFSLDAVLTETKASMFDVHFPIKSVKDNGECLVVTLDAAKMDMAAIDKGGYLNSFSARLKIDDGTNSMTTSYFTLVRDMDYYVSPIYELKVPYMEEGQQETLGNGWRIKAEVISNSDLNNMASARLMFVQDYSAGIAIYCDAPHEYEFGDVLAIDLGGSSLTNYDGYMEITNLPLDKITKIGHKDHIEPIDVNIEDFFANKYESRYVAIKDVQVVSEDLEKTWVVGSAGTQIGIESADGFDFVVFSHKNSTYGSENVPQGSGTIKGIASRHNDTVQLLFAQQSDMTGLSNSRFVVEEREYNISTWEDNTKTGISGGKPVWKGGDTVYLSDGNISTICTIPDIYDGLSTATVKTKRPLSGNVYCVYPGNAVTQNGTTFFVNVPEGQGNDGSAYMVYSGSSTYRNITLSPRTALIKVTLGSAVEDLSFVRITVDGAPIVGQLKIDENGASVVSGTQSVTVAAHNDNVFYFSVLPGSYTQMMFDVSKANGYFARKTRLASITLNAGTMNTVSLNPSSLSFNVVDLGIVMTRKNGSKYNLYWASCNLGESGFVNSPEEYGDYYSWGEVEKYYQGSYSSPVWTAGYNWVSYKWCNGTANTLNKYNSNGLYGIIDNKSKLDLTDDVANTILGGKWRLPTSDELDALIDNCSWVFQNMNGVAGIVLQSNINGHQLFFPAAGRLQDNTHNHSGNRGYYWASELLPTNPHYGSSLSFIINESKLESGGNGRYFGQSIRAVTE